MRFTCLGLKETSKRGGMAWNFLGWFIFILIVLVVAIILMGKFADTSFGILDKLFG
jgi:hypothetical protein